MRFNRERLEWFFNGIHWGSDLAVRSGSIALFVCVLAQIAFRLVGQPVAWAEAGARFLLIWVVLLGMAAGFRIPTGMKKVAAYIYMLSSLAFSLLLLVTGWQVMMQQIRGQELGSALRAPMWIVGLSLPASGVLSGLAVIESLLLRPERLGFRGKRR